jgi:CRISPR-associated protein Csa2
MVFLSLSARILLNVEALNMVESVGNFIRHRRAPIVVPTNTGFILKYVPVLSGESLAHAYQELLADLAARSGIKVCDNCRAGYFIKHSDDSVLEDWAKKVKDKPEEFEKAVVQNCVVEDIGGFLYAGAQPVKRTSRFQVGYVVPAYDTLTTAAVEAQFHVRYARELKFQSIYNIEVGSAVYVLGFNLDVDGIGILSSIKTSEGVPKEERLKRIELAVKALGFMLSNSFFGAKRSRFTPAWKVLNAVAVVSHPIPITADPAHTKDYVLTTMKKVESFKKLVSGGTLKFEEDIWVGLYKSKDETLPEVKGVEEVDNIVMLMDKALDKILKMIK